jgi:hypothetical protein
MLTKIKKELSVKETLIQKAKKTELKINPNMDYDSISELITEKLINKIKENLCQ